jgi:methionine-rich copper-binding protein CopC
MTSRGLLGAALLAGLVALTMPGPAAAHSTLLTANPAAGSTLASSPATITGDFSEPVDPARSALELRGPDGASIAKGSVPAGGVPTRMVISDVPLLVAGRYEVRWTTVTPDDGGVERGTYTFDVTAAAGTPARSAAPGAASGGPPFAGSTPAPAPVEPAGVGEILVPIVILGLVLVAGAAFLLRRR